MVMRDVIVFAVDSIFVGTPADGGDRDFHHIAMSILDRTHFIFRVRAPSNAYVTLSAHLSVVVTHTYEIQIGMENNSMTYIRVSASGNLLPVCRF